MNFKKLLEKEFIILDGAMGTMLQATGLNLGEVPETMSVEHPEVIIDIHKKYIAAGADIIYTNTFGANRYKLASTGYTVNDIISKSVENARIAANGTDTLIALDISTIGQLLEPTGTLTFEQAYDMFSEMVIAGKNADMVVIETMTDLHELKAALLAVKENSDLPVICTMTFEENLRTFTGCSVESMAVTLEGLGADAIGINCSLGPVQFKPIIEKLSEWTSLPIVVKPNAGLPDPVSGKYDITAEQFAEDIADLIKYGIKFVGGCCGTTPEYIKAISDRLKNEKYSRQKKTVPVSVCSSTKIISISEPRIIGERINPTGKKMFKQALREGNIGYILNQAIEQINAGADILDVNVGLPEINEKSMMITAVKSIQSVVDAPLQIDSTSQEVIEAALRIYDGIPIVNSVNGEQKSLDTILPLVKKYGACVIGLTLDENGIPSKAEDRFRIAEKILNNANRYGIPKEKVFIDCLTLTASAEQPAVMETLKAVKMIKDKLNLKTVLGVSNISFGLPNRELINSNFLTMALSYGLDLPIINPNVQSMAGAVRAYKLLDNIDKNSVEFISCYNSANEQSVKSDADNHCDIFYAVSKGLKNKGAEIVRELLKTKDSMEIINEMLIPALDKVGNDFEKGIIYLPQLIQSAGVAQSAFEVIKNSMAVQDASVTSKGKVILATVKGDIHDIGKNIVKVLLENYGYTVIDLGRDVDYQKVIEAIKKNDCKLVGLSALMTTTLKSMEETIRLIHDNSLDCKIMVGGAVLTPEYALKIGADFYSKDAKQSVDIAKKVLG